MLGDFKDMPESFKRRRVGLAGTADAPVEHIALGGDTLALVAGDGLRFLSLDAAGAAREAGAHRLGWSPAGVSLSPSGAYALLRDATQDRLAVYDRARGANAFEFERTSEKQYPVPGALASVGGDEVLLVSPRVHELEAYYLKDSTLAFRVSCGYPEAASQFVFTHLRPHGREAGTLFALGYFLAEMMDSLVTFSFDGLAGDPLAAARELRERKLINDYANRLAVGPCGDDCAVFFRDPGDYETPSEDDDEDEEQGELWNFRGLYVRRVSDGGLVERLEYDAPVVTGSPIFATGQFYVVGCPDRVELLPRAGVEGEAVSLACRSLSLDPARRRLALLDEAGDVQIIEVP